MRHIKLSSRPRCIFVRDLQSKIAVFPKGVSCAIRVGEDAMTKLPALDFHCHGYVAQDALQEIRGTLEECYLRKDAVSGLASRGGRAMGMEKLC